MTNPPIDNNQNPSDPQQSNPVPPVPGPPPVPGTPPPPGAYYGQQPYNAQPYGVVQQQNEGNAVTAMIMGILSLVICAPLGIVAVIMGNKSRRNIKESNGYLGGDGMALTGIILGWVGIAILIIVPLFYVVVFLIIGIAGTTGS